MAKLKCTHCGCVNPAEKKSCRKCGTPLPRVSIDGGAALEKGADQFLRGQIVANRYTVLDLVGRGGMACIYKVEDNTLKETVALKTMLPEFTKEKALVDRFYNEAKITRQLTHPNIIRVHDFGMADGVMYISMELLEGRTLRGVLDGLKPGQRLPVKTALRIMDQLCAALHYAHDYTIHRDIKPENVMVLNDGTVKLMDFGISKLRADSSLTSTSMVMGTPHYMSPEQLKDSRNVDVRTDVYSMGVMLYEVMTGNIPTGVPKPASQIMKETPPDIDRIIETCMQPDPISRYQSIQELRTAIRAILDLVESNTTAQGTNGRNRSSKRARAGWPKQAVGVTALLFIVVASAAAIWQLDGRRQTLLADANATTPTPAPANDPTQLEYNALNEWLRLAEPIAKNLAGEDEFGSGIVQTAEILALTAASSASVADYSAAVASARDALACYIGLIDCPNDALFVPPGTVTIDTRRYDVDPFFIAKNAITNAEFQSFTRNAEGGWGDYYYSDDADDSAKAITFYDAQMFAAHHRGRLPTQAEWMLAFQRYPDALASDVADWTQSLADGLRNATGADELNRLRFGAQVMTIGANPERENGVDAWPVTYDYVDATLGARCAWPVPLDRTSLDSVLSTP